MATAKRKLPKGIQSFKKIRTEGFLYVDKTDIVWQLVNEGAQYNYLSRPRRFGKSVLVDTLQMYLEGRRELFEGLKIMDLETEWVKHPVIRLDMSGAGASAETIRSYLGNAFKSYEEKYQHKASKEDSLAVRFDNIVKAAYDKTGQQVCVLIDEYDSPLLHSWGTADHEGCTALYREVFAVLKMDDAYEGFVLITGITKFTQISLFSVLNNLSNISFDATYATLCGITEQEITENFQTEMQQLADKNGWSMDETHDRLKEYYDGYHFSKDNMTDVYNPFSLVNALSDGEIRNYWASSGSTSLLPKFVKDLEVRLSELDHSLIDSEILTSSDVTDGGAELFLYQSGYLTIKGFEDGIYRLGFPNAEVRQALCKVVVPALTLREASQVLSTQTLLKYQLMNGNVDEAMKCMKALVSDAPYSNKRIASMGMEERYRFIISTLLNAIGFRVEVERMLAKGRIDIVAWCAHYIYVIELKLRNNGGLASVVSQMQKNGYGEPFQADSRKPICLAIELDDLGKGILAWQVVE